MELELTGASELLATELLEGWTTTLEELATTDDEELTDDEGSTEELDDSCATLEDWASLLLEDVFPPPTQALSITDAVPSNTVRQ